MSISELTLFCIKIYDDTVFGFSIQLELEELNIIIKMFVINRF